MFRNYLATALRNLGRNKLYGAITIAGLALGFAAAILITLFVRDELTFDRFIPGHEDVYVVALTVKTPSTAPIESLTSEIWTAPLLKAEFGEIDSAARLVKAFFPPLVRNGQIQTGEQNFYWADPDFFRVLPMPVLAGDLRTALAAPDGLVVTQAMARKYFGNDAPIGRTLLVEGHPMRVTVVLRNPPGNSHLNGDFYASSLAAFSTTKRLEAMNGVGSFSHNTLTYLRLKPSTSPEHVRSGLQGFVDRRMPIQPAILQDIGAATRTPHLVGLGDLHLYPSDQGAPKPPGNPQAIAGIALVGLLIVAIAAINFVTLMTARAGRRAVEVGVRKAAGASQRDLVIQFVGEALIYVVLSMLLAVALAELLLPAFNALLQRRISFSYVTDPMLAGGLLGVAVVVSLLAGSYPAFVLSAFKPASVLKGGPVKVSGSNMIRQALVLTQFAILIALIVVTLTIVRQTKFALNEGMRVDKEQVLVAFGDPCTDNFRDQVRALPGVRRAACSSGQVLGFATSIDAITVGRREANLDSAPIDFDFLELYGLKPVAGRFFDQGRPQDAFHDDATATSSVVINETAARKLGFTSASAAIGKTAYWHGAPALERRDTEPAHSAEIIGVTPDFSFDNVKGAIRPTIYYVGPKVSLLSSALHVKLDGRNTPEVMAGIDRTWRRMGDGKPLIKAFVDQFMLLRYLDTLIQGAVIAIAAILAVFIASLGLFALSVFTSEQRTKEIGIRKAMGASTGSITRLLVYQFTKPVLLANFIAWPIAWLAMNRWLNGFAYHVDLAPWTFLAAATAATLIAWATVFGQSWLVARSKPVTALRYE